MDIIGGIDSMVNLITSLGALLAAGSALWTAYKLRTTVEPTIQEVAATTKKVADDLALALAKGIAEGRALRDAERTIEALTPHREYTGVDDTVASGSR